MNTSIPLCHLPNSKHQVFDDTCKRSAFQIAELARIAAQDDFAYFVTCLTTEGQVIVSPSYACPFAVMWYTKNGACNYGYLGQRRWLQGPKHGDPQTPVPLDHVVYESRCLP